MISGLEGYGKWRGSKVASIEWPFSGNYYGGNAGYAGYGDFGGLNGIFGGLNGNFGGLNRQFGGLNRQFGRLNGNFGESITGFGSYGGYKKGIYDSPRVK